MPCERRDTAIYRGAHVTQRQAKDVAASVRNSIESVVTDIFEAMIYLSTENGRLKDYFDVYQCARVNRFDGELRQQAIRNTFRKRRTPFVSV